MYSPTSPVHIDHCPDHYPAIDEFLSWQHCYPGLLGLRVVLMHIDCVLSALTSKSRPNGRTTSKIFHFRACKKISVPCRMEPRPTMMRQPVVRKDIESIPYSHRFGFMIRETHNEQSEYGLEKVLPGDQVLMSPKWLSADTSFKQSP